MLCRFEEALIQLDALIERINNEKEQELAQDLNTILPDFLSKIVENHHEWNSFAQLNLLDGWKSLQNFHLVEDEVDLTELQSTEEFVKEDEKLVTALLQGKKSTQSNTSTAVGMNGSDSIVNEMKLFSTIIEDLSKEMTESSKANQIGNRFLQDERVPSTVWKHFLLSWRKKLHYKYHRYSRS